MQRGKGQVGQYQWSRLFAQALPAEARLSDTAALLTEATGVGAMTMGTCANVVIIRR